MAATQDRAALELKAAEIRRMAQALGWEVARVAIEGDTVAVEIRYKLPSAPKSS